SEALRRADAMTERWLSRALETDTYSPSAIDSAPPTSAATPATRIAVREVVAAATPTTTAATDTMPSLAPSTPARSQFRRAASPSVGGVAARSTGCTGCVVVVMEKGNHHSWIISRKVRFT